MSDLPIESAMVLYLKGWNEVRDLCADRVYLDFIPEPPSQQGDYNLPAIALSVDNDDESESLDQPSTLIMAEFEISCWGDTKQDADDLRRAVRDSLNGFIGTIEIYTNVKIEGLGARRAVNISVGQRQRRCWMSAVTGTIWYYRPASYQLNTLTA